MSALKRIEEKHKPVKFMSSDKGIVDICPVCLLLPPCDMVKLARALDWVSHINTVPRPTREACKRTLEEL